MRAGGAGEVSGLGVRGSGNWSRRRSGRGCRNCGRRRGRGAKTGFGEDGVAVAVAEEEVEEEEEEEEEEVEEKGGGVDGGVAKSESVSSGSGGGGVVVAVVVVVVAGVREIEGGVDIVWLGGGGGCGDVRCLVFVLVFVLRW